MIKLILGFYRLFGWCFRLLGVNVDQFLAVLEVKLRMDGRRRRIGMETGRRKSTRNSLVITVLTYTFLGAMLSLVLLKISSPLAGMTVVHAAIMMMIAMSLISDFSSVMLDTTDNVVLLPRPIDGRTLLCARIAHIVTYLSMLTLSLSAGTFVTGTITYHPLFGLVFLGTLICSVCLVVCAVNLFYLAVLRFADQDKLRDVVVYVQIALSIVFFGGYQLLPRLMDMTALDTLRIDDRWWIYFFPPAWLAGPIDLLASRAGTPQQVLTFLAVAVPLAGLWAIVLVGGPRFTEGLRRLSASPTARRGARANAARRDPFLRRLSRFVCGRGIQGAAFELVWRMCSRDRPFKLRTYPSMAMMGMVGVILLVTSDDTVVESIAKLADSKAYVFLLYYGCLFIPMPAMIVRYSDQHEAAWIYEAMPLAKPGDVLMATLKTILVRFALPFTALVAIVAIAIWGVRLLPDVVLAIEGTLLVSVTQAIVVGRRFPFSEEYHVAESSGKLFRSMIFMGLPVMLATVHFGLSILPGGVLVGIVLVGLICAAVWRQYANTDWATMRRCNAESPA